MTTGQWVYPRTSQFAFCIEAWKTMSSKSWIYSYESGHRSQDMWNKSRTKHYESYSMLQVTIVTGQSQVGSHKSYPQVTRHESYITCPKSKAIRPPCLFTSHNSEVINHKSQVRSYEPQGIHKSCCCYKPCTTLVTSLGLQGNHVDTTCAHFAIKKQHWRVLIIERYQQWRGCTGWYSAQLLGQVTAVI